MGRKYLKEIGIELKDTPWGWNGNDKRKEKWRKERKEIGFDERETWSLDRTMELLLYERLCRYKEIAEKVIDLDFHVFEYNNEELTQRQCIDRMIEGLKLELTLDPFDEKREDKYVKEKIENIWKIYDLCKITLWW